MDMILNKRVDGSGNTLLNLNFCLGDINNCKYFLEIGADPSIPDFDYSYPLHNLVLSEFPMEEKKYFINELIKRNADIDATNNKGETALHLASMYGDKNVTEELLSKGANINLVDNNNSSPLHFAVCFGNAEIAKILKGKGADVTIKNRGGLTPLDMADRCSNSMLIEALREGETSSNQPLNKTNSLISNISAASDVMDTGVIFRSSNESLKNLVNFSMPQAGLT